MSFAALLSVALAASSLLHSNEMLRQSQERKPRVVVMTDGEVDDQSSMIRFLLYTSDIELLAIIETNSVWQRSGHSRENWYEAQLDAYEAIHQNLIKHNPAYPTADEIRRKSFVGDEDPDHLIRVADEPARSRQIPGGPVEYSPEAWPDTPGSDRIVELLLESNPEPVHIQAWGGGNTAARALHKLKTTYPRDYTRALSKVVIYNISYQDDAGNYIETHHPLVTMLYSGAFHKTWAYDVQTHTAGFIAKEVKAGHGPLGALYPQSYVSEGDTPAFLYTVANGLRNREHPTYGGWGGRFAKSNALQNVYADARDDGDILKPLNRWVAQANRDFAARLDWAVADRFSNANHHPVIKLRAGTNHIVRAGQTVSFSARGTTDPDGNQLAYKWWQYREAGTYGGPISLTGDASDTVRFTVPHGKHSGTVHLILEVSDNGTPQLVSYKRVVIEVQP